MAEQETPLHAPKFIIIAPAPFSPSQAENFRKHWDNAALNSKPIVLDAGFKVFAVNGDGQWTLLDSSAIIP